MTLDPSVAHHGALCFALAGLGELAAARSACKRALLPDDSGMLIRGMLAFVEKRPADARREWQNVGRDDPVQARQVKPWLSRLESPHHD